MIIGLEALWLAVPFAAVAAGVGIGARCGASWGILAGVAGVFLWIVAEGYREAREEAARPRRRRRPMLLK